MRSRISTSTQTRVPSISFFSAVLLSAVFGLLLAAPAAAQEGRSVYSISGVRISGNHRVDSAAVIAQLANQSGSITDILITEEVKSLYKTGFFSQVSASIVPDPSDPSRKLIQYDVVEKPVIRKVFIKGNKEVAEDDLKEIFKFGTNRFLDRSKIFALTKSALALYQQKGFYDAAFEYSVTPVGENQVDLVLTVNEGQRYKIRSIEFRGLKNIEESDLRSAVQTKRYRWYNSWLLGTGRLNVEMLNNDKALIRQFFLDNGYIDASLSDPVIEAKDGDITIAFNVEEGRQYKLGNISLSGDKLDDPDKDPLEAVKAKPGSVFSASGVREDAFKISDSYTDIGYAFANVVPDTRINRQDALVDINFAVSKGKVVTVNRISIRGNDKTYDNVIRRELTIDEQDKFSSSKVKRSQQLLERLGYFEEASITTEPAGTDDQVNLNVNVREGATGTFSAGAGYSSADGPLVNARVSENNIFGTGRSASINADLGTQRDSLNFNLTDRRLNDSYWYGSFNLVRSYRQYSDFDRILTGGSVEAGYPLEQIFGESFEDIQYSVEYQYLGIEIKNVDPSDAAKLVINSQGHSSAGSVIQKLARNTINNPLDPKTGSRQVLSAETSGAGGDEKFYLFEARQQWFYPLVETEEHGDIVFSWRANIGYGDTYDDEAFPLFKRYFPGGINSVRGYKNRRLGPTDSKGHQYGGSKELVTNFDLIFPIAKSAGLKGVVFFDAGDAFDDNDSIRIDDLRKAYGYGIRWTSPLGPIRVEFGIPIDRREGESSLVTMFAFGAPF